MTKFGSLVLAEDTIGDSVADQATCATDADSGVIDGDIDDDDDDALQKDKR